MGERQVGTVQDIEHFGSVTVVTARCGHSAVVIVGRPNELHEYEDDWNRAVRFLVQHGFEPPADDPTTVSPTGAETYQVHPVVHLAAVSA